MDWTKIKIKHFAHNYLTKPQKGTLITLMAYTAMIERMPTDKEVGQIVGKTSAKLVSKVLETLGESLPKVLQKVLEDVEKVNHRKSVSRRTSARYRKEHKKSDVSRDVSNDTTEKRREEKSIYKGKNKSFKKPSKEEISTYINEKGFQISSARFFDFYESKGWMVGKNKMKDWKAAVRTWARNDQPKTEGRKYAVL